MVSVKPHLHMAPRAYKTRRWLWFLISLAAFFAIGCVHWIDMKGGNALFAVSILRSLGEVLSGRAPLVWLWILAPSLIGWIIVAGAVGWCVQAGFVLLLSRHEKSKPSA